MEFSYAVCLFAQNYRRTAALSVTAVIVLGVSHQPYASKNLKSAINHRHNYIRGVAHSY